MKSFSVPQTTGLLDYLQDLQENQFHGATSAVAYLGPSTAWGNRGRYVRRVAVSASFRICP